MSTSGHMAERRLEELLNQIPEPLQRKLRKALRKEVNIIVKEIADASYTQGHNDALSNLIEDAEYERKAQGS